MIDFYGRTLEKLKDVEDASVMIRAHGARAILLRIEGRLHGRILRKQAVIDVPMSTTAKEPYIPVDTLVEEFLVSWALQGGKG